MSIPVLTPPTYDSAAEFLRIARENNHGITNTIVPNTGTESWFIEFCKAKQPFEIINLIAGFTNDFPATVLAAETVNKILQYHSIDNKLAHRYVHVLCPMVHDRWNLNKDKCIGGATGSVVDCYWRDLGDLTYKPQMVEFTNIVLRTLNSSATWSMEQSAMSTKDTQLKCSRVGCIDPNIAEVPNNYTYYCTQCRSLFHHTCFITIYNEIPIGYEWAHQHIRTCPACHTKWDLKNPDAPNKGFGKW